MDVSTSYLLKGNWGYFGYLGIWGDVGELLSIGESELVIPFPHVNPYLYLLVLYGYSLV